MEALMKQAVVTFAICHLRALYTRMQLVDLYHSLACAQPLPPLPSLVCHFPHPHFATPTSLRNGTQSVPLLVKSTSFRRDDL